VPQDFAKRKQPASNRRPPPRRKAQAQAQRHTQEPSQRGKSFRLYMSGVLTGMFISLLFYLYKLPALVDPGQEVAAVADPEAVVEVPKPRFEFYTMLPKQTMAEEEQVETVEPAADVSIPPTPSAAPQPYFLQAGSFRQKDDAERRRAELLLLGLEPDIEESSTDNGLWFRVSLGPFESHDAVAKARGLLASQNIESVLMKRGAP
jgi:cell division protein FtsN